MTKGFIFLIVMVVIAVVVRELFGGGGKEEKKKALYQYKKKDFLITRAEHEFFDVLVEVLGDQYYVFTQVHLPTILKHDIPNGQNWKGAFSHINGKSVDFVICDKVGIKPILAIELDDKSHEKLDRIERDSEVERMLQDAGMPLLRFENHGSFDKEEIKSTIQKVLTI
jgi:hypothetical protein